MLNENVGILEHHGETAPASANLTIPGLLCKAAERGRKRDAFKFKQSGRWKNVSMSEFLARVEELFFALRALGIREGDRVAILSENRVEWAITDYAALCAGAATVPVYPTLSESQIEALLRDADPALVFVSTASLLSKLERSRAALRYVVAFDDVSQSGVLRLDGLYEMGRPDAFSSVHDFRSAALAVDPDDVATIIYTSGTTGVPKGAMLTHRNLASNVQATLERLPLSETDLTLSFLPLAHIFQRHVDYAALCAGASIAYAENLNAVPANIAEVRPTFVAGVPRFFEKVYARILSEVSKGPAIRRIIFDKALRAGFEHLRTGAPTLAYRAADRVVFQKIRHRLGGRVRFFISGGAALDPEVAEFFFAVGLPVFEGYGLTETSPVLTLNGPGRFRVGSVGRPVRDVELRIAPDGEILARGANIMRGYYKKECETTEALREGWFYTGDIGTIDGDGYLHITDRKKDLIVTSSGKNIAPQMIEGRLKRIPYFDHIMIVGDGRPFVSALIAPNLEALTVYAREHAISFSNPADLMLKCEIYDFVMKEIESRTRDLAPFEKVRRIAFLEKPFTIDGGELTPTMKVRRSAIERMYKAEIDRLYAG